MAKLRAKTIACRHNNSNKKFITSKNKNNIISGEGNKSLTKKPEQIWNFLLDPNNLSKINWIKEGDKFKNLILS